MTTPTRRPRGRRGANPIFRARVLKIAGEWAWFGHDTRTGKVVTNLSIPYDSQWLAFICASVWARNSNRLRNLGR